MLKRKSTSFGLVSRDYCHGQEQPVVLAASRVPSERAHRHLAEGAVQRLGFGLALTNEAAKGRRGGRTIPIATDLKAALKAWKVEAEKDFRKSP